jgi:hypothetical protein
MRTTHGRGLLARVRRAMLDVVLFALAFTAAAGGCALTASGEACETSRATASKGAE